MRKKKNSNSLLYLFTAITAVAVIAAIIVAAFSIMKSEEKAPNEGLGTSDSDSETSESEESEDSRESESESESEVTPPEEKRISFLGCGDNIIYSGNVSDAASLAVPGGRQYNFKPSYRHVADLIAAADISFINQETLMCGDGYGFSYYPQFNGPQDLGYDLVEVGFDAVGIANNHMLDKGEAGLLSTIEFWRSLDVTLIGGYENEEAYLTPTVIERDGVRIAMVNLTEWTNGIRKWGENDVYVPYFTLLDGDGAPIIENWRFYPNEEVLKGAVDRAKEVADAVIVVMHWGNEGSSFTAPVTECQKQSAQILADAGADVIIGSHPHVIQPVEWITGKDGNKTLCVYSLGNFIGEQANDYQMLGGMISFDIVSNGIDPVTVENVVFIPTVIYFNGWFGDNSVYPLEDFTDELAASHGMSYYDSVYGYSDSHHTTVAELTDAVKNVIAAEFLPDFLK